MKCSRVKKYLSVFLDGELDKKEQQEIEEHLKKCSGCKREHDLLTRSWEMLSEWKDIEPSPHFKARFWQKVEEQGRDIKRPVLFPQLFPWAPVFATALVLLVCISLYIFPKFHRKTGLSPLVREQSKMIASLGRDTELKQRMDRFTDEELGKLIQAVSEEAEAVELAMVTEGEKYLNAVMDKFFNTESNGEVIVYNLEDVR